MRLSRLTWASQLANLWLNPCKNRSWHKAGHHRDGFYADYLRSLFSSLRNALPYFPSNALLREPRPYFEMRREFSSHMCANNDKIIAVDGWQGTPFYRFLLHFRTNFSSSIKVSIRSWLWCSMFWIHWPLVFCKRPRLHLSRYVIRLEHYVHCIMFSSYNIIEYVAFFCPRYNSFWSL